LGDGRRRDVEGKLALIGCRATGGLNAAGMGGSSDNTPDFDWLEPDPAHPTLPLATAGDLICHWLRQTGVTPPPAGSGRPLPPPPGGGAPPLPGGPPAQTTAPVPPRLLKPRPRSRAWGPPAAAQAPGPVPSLPPEASGPPPVPPEPPLSWEPGAADGTWASGLTGPCGGGGRGHAGRQPAGGQRRPGGLRAPAPRSRSAPRSSPRSRRAGGRCGSSPLGPPCRSTARPHRAVLWAEREVMAGGDGWLRGRPPLTTPACAYRGRQGTAGHSGPGGGEGRRGR